MNPSQLFYELIQSYPATADKENSSISINLPENCDQINLTSAAQNFGFKPRGSIIRGNVLQLKPDALFWPDHKLKNYYVSHDELICDFLNTGKIRAGSLVYNSVTKKVELLSESSLLNKKLEITHSFIKLLVKLSDQSVPESGPKEGFTKTVFFIKSGDSANKYELETKLSWNELKSALPNDPEQLANIEAVITQLESRISLGDIQDSERKNCMRSALDSLMSKAPKQSTMFGYLLSLIEPLKSIYTDHHDMFLSEFSVNKVLQEITAKDLEYVTKINEFTSSAQTKALAIPGAMVAIAAVLRTTSSLSAFGVLIGLVLTTAIIDRCLSIYKKSFLHIDKHIENVFDQYDNLAQESKVRLQAEATRKNLYKLNREAKLGLEFIRGIVWATVLIAGFYLMTQYQLQPPKLS
ncbi:hypothetical protein [Vibrio pomeroyi]|uniref:hypothetical protein n=1 Tax=Vibrio pomeroyi TaxID=198832 RepID=UPI0035A69647